MAHAQTRATHNISARDYRPSAHIHGPTLAVLTLVVVLVSACGGVQFDRSGGAHKYRALPVGTEVRVVGATLELAQPVVDIGELAWLEKSTNATPNEAEATKRFVRHASRYGCDAVAGLKFTTEEKKTVKKAKSLGPDGKPIYKETEISSYAHDFRARCIRTSAAPGGLLDGSGEAAQGPAPALPKVTDEPLPTDGVDGSGKSETDADVVEVWKAIGRYKGLFLKHWADRLVNAPASAQEALDAMNELMAQISGPAGLWRKRVPQEWFGCGDNPKSEQCVKLVAAVDEFGPWERFSEQMLKQKGAGAKTWLKRNKARMLGYMTRYVPSVESLSGLQGTPLFAERVR
jgi:uncharacterized protein YbjQ (UPF0145 family)